MSRTLPDLIDALVAGAPAQMAVGVNVYDGLPMEVESGDALAIGVDDYEGDRVKASAGSSTEDWAGRTFAAQIDESGSITCVAWSQNGNRDQKAARDAVFAIHSDLRTWLRSVLTGAPGVLGVPSVWDVRVGGVDELSQSQSTVGAMALIRFSIAYQARI